MDAVRQVLESKDIRYSERGKDYIIKCLNPDHEDTNPSLRVDKLTGLFHCFSCGYKGTLLKDSNVHNFQRSIKVQNLQKKIAKLLYKNPIIPKGATPFEIDFRGIKGSTYKKFNAFEDTQQKPFIDRVVFPITDLEGDIIVFQGRHKFSTGKDKYLFHPPGIKAPCYPPEVLGIEDSIIVVEGLFDMLNLYDKGLTNVVCNFGCSPLKDKKLEQNRFMQYKIQGIDTVYILFDGDKAGRAGSTKLKHVLTDIFNVDIIELDDGVDPGALTEESVKSLRNVIYASSNSR